MARSRRGSAEDPEVAKALEQAADAFDDERYDEVHALAEKVLAKDPRRLEALHFTAAAAHRDGDFERAEECYRRALKLYPDDPELLLGAADLAVHELGEERPHLDEALGWVTRGRKLAEREDDVELVFEFLVLEGIARNQAGEGEAALACLDRALQMRPDSPDVALERAIALFELCRFDESRKSLVALEKKAPEDPWVKHYLGLLAERRGEEKESKRYLAAARELAPEELPSPVHLSDEEFDAAVKSAVERLPEHVKQYLDNTTIAVEPIPADEDLTAEKPPLSPSILGVFCGTPVGQRSVSNAYDHFPAAIVLYQRNLERFAKTRDELIEQIGITLMHEVGHLIGLDEEDLWERGLD